MDLTVSPFQQTHILNPFWAMCVDFNISNHGSAKIKSNTSILSSI